MTQSTHLAVVSSLALGVLAVAAVAAAEAPARHRREHKLQREFQSRAITNKEGTIIARQRHRVMRLKRRAFQDDTLTRREAKKIKKARRRLHRTIDWARHNDQVRRRPHGRDWWIDRTRDRWGRAADHHRHEWW